MAYKFQSGDATLSGSVTLVGYQDLLFETDGVSDIGTAAKEASVIYTTRLTASVGISGSAIYADDFYGNGTGITGISSDTVTTTTDNTNTTRYVPFVDQATGQAGETVYIDSAIAMNPYSGSMLLSASINGLGRAALQFASGKNIIGIQYDEGDALMSLAAQLPLDVSSSDSVALMGGQPSGDGGVYVYPKLIVSDSEENVRLTVNAGGLTGVNGALQVSSSIAGGSTISAAGNISTTTGNITTAGGNVSGSGDLQGNTWTTSGGNLSSAGALVIDSKAYFASNSVQIHAGGKVGIGAAGLVVSGNISSSLDIAGRTGDFAGVNVNKSGGSALSVQYGATFAAVSGQHVRLHAGGGVGITGALKVSSSISASNSISGLNLVMDGGALTAAGAFTAKSHDLCVICSQWSYLGH